MISRTVIDSWGSVLGRGPYCSAGRDRLPFFISRRQPGTLWVTCADSRFGEMGRPEPVRELIAGRVLVGGESVSRDARLHVSGPSITLGGIPLEAWPCPVKSVVLVGGHPALHEELVEGDC